MHRGMALICFFLAAMGISQLPAAAASAVHHHFPAPAQGDGTDLVTIYGTTDLGVFEPVIRGFQLRHSGVSVAYVEVLSLDLYERILTETAEGVTADLAVSSAMDLQMKLANDGYARPWRSVEAAALPRWATWRDEAFGITFEPAVIVYHRPSFVDLPVPRTREDLIALLEQTEEFFGRVGAYDAERSGLGYLFLARDEEQSQRIWDLYRALGAEGVKLFSNSSAILERVADGRFALGYSVLGSYAIAMAEEEADLGVIMPEDYTTVLSRVAIVPRAAANTALGGLFLDFMLSREGQAILARESRLASIREDVEVQDTVAAMRAELGTRIRPIPVSPAILVYLDELKRRRLLATWNAALGGR